MTTSKKNNITSPGRSELDAQGATALLAATLNFLSRNSISHGAILKFVRSYPKSKRRKNSMRVYREMERREDIGVILGTWFSNPKFLDDSGRPRPLSTAKGSDSIRHLIRASGVRIQPIIALEMLKRSPSVKVASDGKLLAVRRLFVLPKQGIFRAAFVVEKYLDTVVRIMQDRKSGRPLLLERSCHVSEIDFRRLAPILRDIGDRSSAFMDSIDGDLESRRLRRSNRKNVGEIGVHMFVWAKSVKSKKNISRRIARAAS